MELTCNGGVPVATFDINLLEVTLAGKSTVIVPALVIGLPDTFNVVLLTPTLVTVPLSIDAEIVTLPLLPLMLIPVPAFNLVTPVLTMFITPVVVIGLPVT